MKHPPVMVGNRYGRLTVVAAGARARGGLSWLCVCDCGRSLTPMDGNLKGGRSKSCGHHHRTTHGEAKPSTPEWRAWRAMVSRCSCPTNREYRNYGGRGVTFCARWAAYEAFLADVGRRPGPSYSIDRKNNDGNYEPGNVRWATKKEQTNNRRSTRRICVSGECMSMTDAIDRFGVNRNTLWKRLALGWSTEEACGLVARAGAK